MATDANDQAHEGSDKPLRGYEKEPAEPLEPSPWVEEAHVLRQPR